MKKILISLLFLSNTILVSAQTTTAGCEEFIKLVNAVDANELKQFKTTTAFTSDYYRTNTLFVSTLNLPGIIEGYVNEGYYGPAYDAFIKTYGNDETAATADFSLLVNKFADCLEKEEISVASDLTTYIFYKKTKITIHAFESSNVNAWVSTITIERQRE